MNFERLSPDVARLVTGFGLLEGARWYPEQGLLFSDMTVGGVYCLGVDETIPRVVVPHRRGIGGLVAHAAGGLVVTGKNVGYKAADGTTTVILTAADDELFFNDLGVDHMGRVIVGSVAGDPLTGSGLSGLESGLGRLYVIDLDGTATPLFADVVVSNGIDISPDGLVAYHVDTRRETIWAIDLSDTSSRRRFADTSALDGEPDGLTVAADGSVWVAMAGGGFVFVWDSSGRPVRQIAIPQPLVTSVCFGGPDLSTLYVMTGPTSLDDSGGSIYSVPTTTRGLPAPVARIGTDGIKA